MRNVEIKKWDQRERERERERAEILSEKELTSNLSVVVVVVCSEIWSKEVGERSFLTMMTTVKRRSTQSWENGKIEREIDVRNVEIKKWD